MAEVLFEGLTREGFVTRYTVTFFSHSNLYSLLAVMGCSPGKTEW